MSTKIDRAGLSQDSFGGRDERTAKTLEEWELDEKRFEERIHYHERVQYRCTVIGERGFEVKCRRDCSQCSCYSARRPNKVSLEQLSELGIEPASDAESPVHYAQRREMEDRVGEAIASLPSKDLRTVARMLADSFSFSEIGRALGISKQAAHKKWEKARELLRERLQDYWDSINS